jgi:hypothetical protein
VQDHIFGEIDKVEAFSREHGTHGAEEGLKVLNVKEQSVETA